MPFVAYNGPGQKQMLGKSLKVVPKTSYALGCPPSQDASHHQIYSIFRIGDPELNLHLPQLLGGGTTQVMPINGSKSFQKLHEMFLPLQFFSNT